MFVIEFIQLFSFKCVQTTFSVMFIKGVTWILYFSIPRLKLRLAFLAMPGVRFCKRNVCVELHCKKTQPKTALSSFKAKQSQVDTYWWKQFLWRPRKISIFSILFKRLTIFITFHHFTIIRFFFYISITLMNV